MTLPRQLDLQIIQGDTFIHTERLALETTPLIYKAITAITKAAPVSITSATHGLKTGWRVAVVSVGGMRQLKAVNWPLRSTDYHLATASDANTVALNDVNSSDYTAYTSGGYLVYPTPLSLASCTARMTIRETVDSTTALDELVSTGLTPVIALDDTEHTITITLAAATTAAYTFSNAVYDFELVTAAGVVTKLLSGNITLVEEVTR
jgi:hypothetical protein